VRVPRPHVPIGVLLCAGLLGGCAVEPREVADLALASDWTILGAEEDPFPTHRAATKRLCPSGFGEDLGVLDIDTATCSYVSAVAPTRAEVRPGDRISVLAWHQALASTDPLAEGHMAFLLDGEPLWELQVPIPAAAEVYDTSVPIDRLVPRGADLVVHVHNHGGNTWRVGHVRAIPPEALED
jgi:hypothetical protein